MACVGVNHDSPIVMMPIIIPYDGIESEHSSVRPKNGTRLTGKLNFNSFLDELESKQIPGCSSPLYFFYKILVFQVACKYLSLVNKALIGSEEIPA